MLDKILAIVLEYEENGVTQATIKSLANAGIDEYLITSREGVGSMAKAFNEAMREGFMSDYIWFITNVTFPPELPAALIETMEANPDAAAVHPGMVSSHSFINNAKAVGPANFVEWTAPLVRLSAWDDVGELDEQMPYVHFDLDWSHRAKLKGWELLVDGRHRIDHTYLHIRAPEVISRIRAQLRAYRHAGSLRAITEKWGTDWKQALCKNGNCG